MSARTFDFLGFVPGWQISVVRFGLQQRKRSASSLQANLEKQPRLRKQLHQWACHRPVAHLDTAIVDIKDCIVTTKAEIRALDDGVKTLSKYVAEATEQRKQDMRITQH